MVKIQRHVLFSQMLTDSLNISSSRSLKLKSRRIETNRKEESEAISRRQSRRADVVGYDHCQF